MSEEKGVAVVTSDYTRRVYTDADAFAVTMGGDVMPGYLFIKRGEATIAGFPPGAWTCVEGPRGGLSRA